MVLNWSRQLADLIGPEDGASLASELARLNDIPQLRKGDELYLTGEWLQTLVDQVTDYIFVKDRKSRFVMANRQVAIDIGYSDFSELLGKTDLELHPHEIGSGFMEIEAQVMATKVPQIDHEEFLILPSGRRKWFSASKYPVTNDRDEVVGIMGICRDTTERKKAEKLQQGQNKVLQEIAGGKPLGDVLATLVLTIEDQLDGVVGSVMLTDESGTRLLYGVAPNLPKAYVDQTNRLPVGPRMGSCGTAIHTRESVFVDDVRTHELWEDHQDIMRNFDMRSCWSVPFFSKDSRALGTFGLYSREVRFPTEHEKRLATEAARLASIAVERDQAESKIRYLAHHDVLTGLPNRQEFKHKLEEKVETSRKSGEPVAVVFVDLDNFKFVNDSFGHTIGDQVLAIIAERIKSVLAGNHEAIRFGGDEFVLIVEGGSALKADLQGLMNVLRAEIAKTIHIGDLSFHVTCSIGAACYPQDAQDAAELLKNADKAMFEAKSSGRDGFKIYDQTRPEKSVNKLTLLEEMRTGIENGEFFLEYQPQYNLVSGRIVGAEALVRWQHPVLGRLMPGEFIALAEESGLIVPLGRWVLHEACRQNRQWQDDGLTPITMGVNVSVRQFRDSGLISDVTAALKDTGLEAGYLELEVTESLLIQNADQAVRLMDDFRRIGLKLAIDDFGTGYSSLAALKSFPLTRLKIDRSFIRDLDFDESDRSIARAIISLGRELGLNVVAEGVESAKQQAFLASCRCETVQGFHFGRPMNATRFGKLLAMTLTPLDSHFGRMERRA
ncbi:sensor domain-containing protein [Roseibium marinum]|uniref:PAS domain S-box-containing protein/diguanylate cyclase (GGDEF)-like protein n=1 Tax=Roseibium marinum TaxID=281252 RepID=A0A2S3UJF5_9HYPH|nr:EAL domain-containing protein [Roseibium marinum]POF27703.1 PAS domain S-box-containing protein/diguanylate cyclase (GGDEF)-like protein [Roseibium marinum]